MRKLIELTLVFLLGGVLALYFLQDSDRPSSHPQDTTTRYDVTPNSELNRSIAPLPAYPSPEAAAERPGSAKLQSAKQRLEEGKIESFLASFRALRSADDTLRQAYRATFFHALQQLKDKKQIRTAIQWLNAYLQTEYDDVLALQALAEFQYLNSNYLAAIDTLYTAKSYAHDTSKIQQIVTTLRAITNDYAKQLRTKDDHLGLLDLYQRLVTVEPEHSAHYVGLAEAYMALGNEADARQALNIIAYDPDAGTKAHQLLNLIEAQTAKASANAEPITLSRHGNNLLTKVLFNNQIYGNLLLDTGASLTVITPQLLQELSLNHGSPLRTAWFNTANGVVEAPIYRIERLSIGGQTVDQLEVAVMDLNNHHINGLLGMNYLQHFRFSIDQQNNVLYLSPRD